jgi:hypothetical protein
MALVVAGIGLSGTSYVVGYLRERLTLHGIEHNRAIAASLQSLLRAELRPEERTPAALQGFAHKYGAFGYRIFFVEPAGESLTADSGATAPLPKPIAASWLRSATPLAQSRPGAPPGTGAAAAVDAAGHPLLVWVAPLESGEPWGATRLIGVASDRKTLTSFLGDLHWHLDGVLILTYL